MLLFYQYQASGLLMPEQLWYCSHKHDANDFNSAFPEGRAAQNQPFKLRFTFVKQFCLEHFKDLI